MNVTQYIEARPELSVLHFPTVYKTIISLIGDGILSMDDFQKKTANIYLPDESNG